MDIVCRFWYVHLNA